MLCILSYSHRFSETINTTRTEVCGICTEVFFKVLITFCREAFRDSVAQAGTLPALSAISDWIHKDIISENEAAEILSVLPRSALTPTPEYIELLFVSTDKYVKKLSSRVTSRCNIQKEE
jgi:ribosomal protein S14